MVWVASLEVEVDYFLNGFSPKTSVLVRVYNQQFQGTMLLMVFDFLGLRRCFLFGCTGKKVSPYDDEPLDSDFIVL